MNSHSLLSRHGFDAYRTLVSRAILLIIFTGVLLVFSCHAQAQALEQAAYWEARANAGELHTRSWRAWEAAGGPCSGDDSGTPCREQAEKKQQDAQASREHAEFIRNNPCTFNEPRKGLTYRDEAREWRNEIDSVENNIANALDNADMARHNRKLFRNDRTWTRAAEAAEREAEALEESVAAAWLVVDVWERRARDDAGKVSCCAQVSFLEMAAFWEASSNVLELTAKADKAWAAAGGACGDEDDGADCRESADEDEEEARKRRELAKNVRENPCQYNEPGEGLTYRDEVRHWRNMADAEESNIATVLDNADRARRNAERGRNVSAWTRAAEFHEWAAEAMEESAQAARRVADVWERRAREADE